MTDFPHVVRVIPGAPRPLTEFIGRTNERVEVTWLLNGQRLLTLTGPGGSGKTRLALSIAEEMPGRLHWVTLASLESAELVAPSVARALGLSDASSTNVTDEIASALADEDVLLVLDTCEHVADAVAAMVESLLVRCPDLTILATSRTPLYVDGEVLWPIPPMGTTADRRASDPYPSDAVELFVERARAVRPDFQVDDDVARRITDICRRLDGNPLAIELCAARAQILSLEQIFAALDDSLRLLVSHRRSVPERQQTLRATLDWSHRLLSEEEAKLFRRLAVFAGGATLEATVAVADQGLTTTSALDLLTGLADHSILRVSLGSGSARYELPPPVRQYAQERLHDSLEETTCRTRHLSWFLSEARTADAAPPGLAKSAAYSNLERELPNLRGAIAWAREGGDRRHELELSTSLASFAVDHGHYREGRAWLDQAVDSRPDHSAPSALDRSLVARAMTGAGTLAFLQCDYAAATARLESARAAFDELHDERGVASALQTLGGIAREQGDYPRAEELTTTSLDIWRSVGDLDAMAGALSRLAFSALLRGDLATARTRAWDTLTIGRRLGDTAATMSALTTLGGVSLASGDLDAATSYLQEAHVTGVKDQLTEAVAYAEEGLGVVALTRGEVAEAVQLLRSSLRRQHELGDHWRTSSLLVELATCRRLRGEPRAAARLLGAAEGLLERIGAALPPLERPERDRTIAFVSARLKDDERETAWMSGRSAPLAASVAAALAGWDSDGSEPPTDPVQPVGSPGQLDPVLTLRSLGRETVQLGERTLGPADFSYAKPRELLFYLADVGSANKSQIGLALWPDASPSELRSAFHTTLHHLRKAVGADRVVFQQGSYRVQRDRLDYDVDAFTQALSEARLASSRAEELRRLQFATQLYGGDYLASTAPGWSEHTRDELRDRYQRALMAMGRLLLSGGGPVGAIDAFRRVVESDPVSEAAHRGLMRCFEATGEPSRAIRQYDQLVRLLRDELGTAPAESTRALYDRIRSQLEVRSG